MLLCVIVALVCMLPKHENDLFFELRIGSDILATRHIPHFDTYSWSRYGTRWDVPEWLAFVFYSLAYKTAGFFGTWLLMASLTFATVLAAWCSLRKTCGALPAFVLTNVMLMSMSDYIQERPYAFTYLFLAVSLGIVVRARRGSAVRLLWLVPICALWANLHQGVVAFTGILFVLSVGDCIELFWLRKSSTATRTEDHARETRIRRNARSMIATAVACCIAACASPYGYRIFWNIFITMRSQSLMSHVMEWRAITILPWSQLTPFLAAVVIVVLASTRSKVRVRVAEFLVIAALLCESFLHVRNIPIFAIASVVFFGPACCRGVRHFWRERPNLPSLRGRPSIVSFYLFLYLIAIAFPSVAMLAKVNAGHALSRRSFGRAVARYPDYPEQACAFMGTEQFPQNLRTLNNFQIGGFLMWRLPIRKDFIDGRLDVFVGRVFDDNLIIAKGDVNPSWMSIVRKYNFDCVITTRQSEASAFAKLPDWICVYADLGKRRTYQGFIFLRRRPELAALIARCLASGHRTAAHPPSASSR